MCHCHSARGCVASFLVGSDKITWRLTDAVTSTRESRRGGGDAVSRFAATMHASELSPVSISSSFGSGNGSESYPNIH